MAVIKNLNAEGGEVTLTLNAAEVAFLMQTAAKDATVATYLKVNPS